MKNEEIIKNNILIATFMGYEFKKTKSCGIFGGNKFTKDPSGNVSYGYHIFKNYHSK